jgi:hypothetical protein
MRCPTLKHTIIIEQPPINTNMTLAEILLLANGRNPTRIETRRTRRDQPDKITTCLELAHSSLQVDVLCKCSFQVNYIFENILLLRLTGLMPPGCQGQRLVIEGAVLGVDDYGCAFGQPCVTELGDFSTVFHICCIASGAEDARCCRSSPAAPDNVRQRAFRTCR